MAAQFEEALGFWGREYAVQMLRGPGSPWRADDRARAQLDAVISPRSPRRRSSASEGDILSLLLDAVDEDGSGLSDQELRDQVMTLLFAGHDTTTSTVTFLFYELARNPHELEPLVTAGEEPAPLDMAVDETLRMYPPAWIGPRRSIEAFELCGISVPGPRERELCSWAATTALGLPDPARFGPRDCARAKATCPGAYVPFGGGCARASACASAARGQGDRAAILRRSGSSPEPRASCRFARCRPSRARGMPMMVREP